MTTSKEIEKQVCEDYLNKATYKEIMLKNSISESLLVAILKRNNISYRGKTRIYCNENYFEVIDTPSKAYYLGFITGDGHITKNMKRLQIALNVNDREVLDDFKKELNSDHIVYESSHFETRPDRNNKMCYKCGICICREKLCSDLLKHGVGPNKSFDLKLPTTINDDLMCHYVRGLLDSDGCWHISKRNNIKTSIKIAFSIPIYSFANELQDFLIKKCNINKTKIQPNPFDTCYALAYDGKIQCKRIYDYLYSKGGPWLDRKYNYATNYFVEDEIISLNKKIKKLETHTRGKYLGKICRCKICKLCDQIYNKFYEKKIYIHSDILSKLSLEYIELYENDTSCRKKIFYDKIKEELDKISSLDSSKVINKSNNIKEHSYLNQLLGFKS